MVHDESFKNLEWRTRVRSDLTLLRDLLMLKSCIEEEELFFTTRIIIVDVVQKFPFEMRKDDRPIVLPKSVKPTANFGRLSNFEMLE